MEGKEETSPFLADHVEGWLESAIYYGISEEAFWHMTIPELQRAISAIKQKQMDDARLRASMDYTLAALTACFMAKTHSKSATVPKMEEIYASLFMDADTLEKRKEEERLREEELSAIRFKRFADSYNARHKEV